MGSVKSTLGLPDHILLSNSSQDSLKPERSRLLTITRSLDLRILT